MPEESEDQSPARGRPMWSGTISFGLVSIPVHLVAAVREDRLALRMLDQDGTPLARRFFRAKEDIELSNDQLIRGYELEKDRFIPVTDKELESLMPEKSRDIDLRLFVPLISVDPVYFERAYFLMPDKESTKAYRLLAETMEKTSKVGIATFVMRDKEYLVAIISEKGFLRAETMRFHDEVRTPKDVELPEIQKADNKEVKQIARAMESITEKTLNPRDLKSDYNDKLLALVTKKQKQGQGVLTPKIQESDKPKGRSVINLMEELQKSLNAHREKSPRKRTGSIAEEDSSHRTSHKNHPARKSFSSKPKARSRNK